MVVKNKNQKSVNAVCERPLRALKLLGVIHKLRLQQGGVVGFYLTEGYSCIWV